MLLKQSMPLILLKLFRFEQDNILIFGRELISARSPVLESPIITVFLEIVLSLMGEELMHIMGSHKVNPLWLSFPSLHKATMWGKEGSRPEGLLCHHGQALGW